MKSGNTKYVLILSGLVLFFGVFFTSKSWMPDDRDIRAKSYDEIVTLNTWQIKVTNASYDRETKAMTFDLFRRAAKEGLNVPEMKLYNGKKSTAKKPLKYVVTQKEIAESDQGAVVLEGLTVKVFNVPKNYWYVSVNLECEGNQEVQTASTDIFGQPVTEVSIAPTIVQTSVQIDFRKASQKGA